MTELMLKMTMWLVAAIALGFIFGWLLAKAVQKKKYDEELDALDAALLDRNEMLDKLEKKFRNEKIMFEKISSDFKMSEKTLAEKTSLVTELQTKLTKVSSSQDDILETKGDNKALLHQVSELEERDVKREKELEEFESVLLKAEEMISENQESYIARVSNLEEQIELLTLENEEKLKSIELYQDTISGFEEELKLYTANSQDDEFVISKDQFTMIEEQLEKYQQEILTLKNEKSELAKESQDNESEKVEEGKAVKSVELDDGSIVKLFRETYKKITKS